MKVIISQIYINKETKQKYKLQTVKGDTLIMSSVIGDDILALEESEIQKIFKEAF